MGGFSFQGLRVLEGTQENTLEPLIKDYLLCLRSEQATSGALLHRINHARAAYLYAISLANSALEKGDIKQYEQDKADAARCEDALRILVCQAGA